MFTFTRHVVDFYTARVKTLDTDEPLLVIWWVHHVSSLHRMRLHKLIVGLDVNCCSGGDPVATLQLCVDRNCLLFQLLQARTVLDSLRAFLRDFNNTFVGVGICSSSFALDRDHGLGVLRTIDLHELAAAGFGNTLLRGTGPAGLVRRVLDREYKPVVILWRRWDAGTLPLDMVRYACFDAYVCFEMGREMGAHRVMV
ncbi:hypothetical protein NL676_001562 [Syzygium grande]|nr:hypothetical protein NL676_001562 [Syzygium grande]